MADAGRSELRDLLSFCTWLARKTEAIAKASHVGLKTGCERILDLCRREATAIEKETCPEPPSWAWKNSPFRYKIQLALWKEEWSLVVAFFN